MSEAMNEYGQPIGDAMPSWQACRVPVRESLTGRYCLLEPLDPDRHGADLLSGHKAAPDARLWTYLTAGPFEDDAQFHAYLHRIAKSTDALQFAVVDLATRHAAGTMALMRMDPANGVIEVGQIAFTPSLQRTRAATEAQFLLMQLVFDDLHYRRYEWKCDHLNKPSRIAAARLGFQFEGVFRHAMVYKQRSRDTAWFSIVDTEWPALRDAFLGWLAPENFDGDRQRTPLADLRNRLLA